MFRVAKYSFWKKGSKYQNRPEERDGHHYDSKLESKVGWELEMRMKAGEFKEINRQVTYPMIVNGYKICSYIADFQVIDVDGKEHVYEAKGIMMPIASLKLKLFEALYPEVALHIIRN